jgi:RNA 2',3'-cyclic 3'-phosphodiesterase
VAGGDRIRLFCALQLPADVVQMLVGWQAEHVPAGRVVPAENLHVTLAFLGARPRAEVPEIERELAEAAAGAGSVRLLARRYRETGGVAMIVFDDVGGAGSALAEELGLRLERLGVYRRERRPWLPHVTVTRFRERPRLDPPLPALGEVDAVRAALYSSVLRPAGARYDVLESVALGGR